MRVVIAPDSFGGTLSAPQAAEAMAEGWRRVAADDQLRLIPLADGGTGFVDVLHTVLGGVLHSTRVTGPLHGAEVDASWLRVGKTAYLEMAQASGLHMVPPERRDPDAAKRAGSRGVGELILAAAADPEVSRIVVGLGGSANTDGGAGALAALGGTPLDADGAPLPEGGAALARCAALAAPPALPAGVELVLAGDVDNPLLGEHGAAAVFGPQKGADAAAVEELDAALGCYAKVLAAAVNLDAEELATAPGGGAAGGLGAALAAVGGRRVSGAGLVRELCGLDAALDAADLVLTGEGSFDFQSLRGKLITTVAEAAAVRGVPCLVLAGRVAVGRREAAAHGVQDAYSVAEHAGGVEASMADPAGTLADLAADIAGQWSGSR
ncbi:glycerate kinase [Pseudonocardia acaciae]|uniref:glycerate kinase family protein n=1 Tax=Pseudonocardia acaciae TaxID=551276 RepID=UPI00048C89CE|nr:glycerate kinase [Pseudonocardia acaciae]